MINTISAEQSQEAQNALYVERRLERRQNGVQMQGLPLQPCTAPQGLAAKLSSKRHHHLRLCWPNASFHPWKNEFLDLENHFLELRWGLRMRPLPDLWGSAPERSSTISTGGSSQACAKLYACGTMSGTTSRRRPGAGTLAHGNRQHHSAEQGSILAKKQQHECSCTWQQ